MVCFRVLVLFAGSGPVHNSILSGVYTVLVRICVRYIAYISTHQQSSKAKACTSFTHFKIIQIPNWGSLCCAWRSQTLTLGSGGRTWEPATAMCVFLLYV